MLRGRDGAPLFFVSQIEDITERKRAEEAVHASERELRELAESMPQIVWATDADGLNIYFNQQWVDYTGLTLDESYGDGWIKPFHPDDRQRAWDAWHGATQHRDIYSLECRLRRADGMYRWWLIRGVPLLNANGEIRKWFGTCTDIEQIKRIENELKAANAFLDAVIEHIPLALFLKDAKSLRYLRLNRAGEDMLGWPKETFVGKNDYDLWPRAQAKFFVEKDREALKETLIDIPEEPVQTRYRGVRLMHTKKVSILDMTGQPIYLLGISEDITESKRIEREQQFLAEVTVALSASLDYEQTLAAVAQLVVQHVADWCAVDVMDEHGRLSRLKVASADPAKAALCALLEQMPPDRHLPHFVESVSESGRPILVEHVTSEWVESFAQTPEHLQAVTATGVISLIAVPLAMRGQPLGVLVFGSSTLSRVFGHGDLRLAEAVADRAAIAIENARLYQASVRAAQFQQVLSEVGAMLASSLDYEQTLTTVAQLVVRDFADWCLIEVIDEREQMKRRRIVARDPAKADLCAVLEHMTIDRQRPHLLRAVFDTKQSLLIEHVTSEHIESAAQGPEHLQALRAVNPTSLMAVPLLRHGRLLGILTFVSSTESRRYGSSDLHLAEALAERAAIAIENARLYRASTHATQLRDQVLGVVAHDLRNPLSAIRMRASLLTRHGAEPERRSQKPLEAIERAVMHMNRLIQDLLDVALMEAGQLTIERARLSARGMMVEAVDMQRSLASSSSLELRIEADSNVPDIWGDRDRLLQVFENLIGNAIKFTKAGGCITVGAASHDHEVIFRVADTGSGIAPEDLPRVFDRFWQATRANRQGAGLGLPITKGIVEAHGGRIWVESTPNRGTTFSFTIPETTSEQGRPSGSSGSSLVEGDRAA
jgi:PAS domain S-box-containing protein